ncbi:MAG: hydantoinase/oxoprolinase family protein [Chloroflexi bacterium]|nr:hydantoinase/oxoprolinase family protein [Chloroflexota bacterium]
MTTSSSQNPTLVLGIDTGGTFTDAMLLNYQTREVLAAHKSLTTKRDLSIGIEEVIDGIHISDPSAIKMVSISTTLATNAIAEGKGKRVGLILIGYDEELVESFKMSERFATPHFHYFKGGHDLYGQEKEPLDLPGILAAVNQLRGEVDALAVSSYFSPLNPEHELRVFEAVSSICDLPIVLGHQLSTKLGSIERATTAALNASLLAILQDFVVAVRRAMAHRHIDAPLMVVRGDGTLMSDEFAAQTPVETIHSGPAASAIGGRFLSGVDDALVLDVGGTTTDLALIEGGQVSVSEQGATVSGYKTAVKAANLLSIALGGDSHIALGRDRKLSLGPERVTPLAYLAQQYPAVEQRLAQLASRTWDRESAAHLQYWYILRQPQASRSLTPQQKTLLEFLGDGPKPVPDILKHMGVLHPVQLAVDELFRQEILAKAGLTPTDLLHAEERFTPWSTSAAQAALTILARSLWQEPEEIQQRIWREATETIVRAVVAFVSGISLPQPTLKNKSFGQWVFQNSLYHQHPHLDTQFRLQIPIIGIGAPAEVFLKDVAAILHTDLILPRHHEVANAVGAVAGSIMVSEEILIYPQLSAEGLDVIGFYVQTNEGREIYEDADEALRYARSLAQERALGAALRSGADNPQVTVEVLTDGLDSYRVRAKAIGNPRLERK